MIDWPRNRIQNWVAATRRGSARKHVRHDVRDRVDRNLGQIMAIGGLILVCGFALGEGVNLRNFAPAWLMVNGLILLILVTNACVGHLLPMQFLRVGWVSMPVLAAVVQITTYFAYRGVSPETFLSWQSITIPTMIVYFVLWLPATWTVVCSIVMCLLPALSGLLALGPIQTTVWTNTPNQLTGVGMVLIFLAIRQRLLRYRLSEAASEDEDLRLAHAVARSMEDARIARLVHDEVLASLSASLHVSGATNAALQAGAERALSVLQEGHHRSGGSDDHVLSNVEFGDQLRALARRLDATYSLDIGIEEVSVSVSAPAIDAELQAAELRDEMAIPATVGATLIAATAESLRNSVRHAGVMATRELCVLVTAEMIRIEIIDDGVGFELAAIDPRRLGVRHSIFASVEALTIGSAAVVSSPGSGTRVVLQWLR